MLKIEGQTFREIVQALEGASKEIKRLYDIHHEMYNGKIGDPYIMAAQDCDYVLKKLRKKE